MAYDVEYFLQSVTLGGTVHPSSAMGDPIHSIEIKLLEAQTGWLRALALRLVRDEGRANDLTQEAIARAWTTPPRGAADEPVLRAWLSKVLKNLVRFGSRDDLRRLNRERSVARSEIQPEATSPMELAEHSRSVLEAVMELDEPYRSTILLRYYEGLPAPEIAKRTGVPASAVRKRLSRAHGMLRSILKRRFGARREDWCVAILTWARTAHLGNVPAPWSFALGGIAMGTKITLTTAAIIVFIGGAWWLRDNGRIADNQAPTTSTATGARQMDPIGAFHPRNGEQDSVRALVQMETKQSSLKLEKQGVRVFGRITSNANEELSKVQASLSWFTPRGAKTRVAVHLNEEGFYDAFLPYPNGLSPYALPHCLPQIMADARGHLSGQSVAQASVEEQTSRSSSVVTYSLDLTLDSGPVGEGLILDANGHPVPAALVVLFQEHGRILARTKTNTFGRYTISFKPPGPFKLAAWSPNAGSGVTELLALNGSRDAHFPDILCRERGSLEGRVLLPSGKPLEGIQVRAYAANEVPRDASYSSAESPFSMVVETSPFDSFASGLSQAAARTDKLGRFHLAGLTPGTYRLTTMSVGPGELLVPDGPYPTGSKDLRLEIEAYCLRVHVSDAHDLPLPGAKIHLSCASTIFQGGLRPNIDGVLETYLTIEPWQVNLELDGAVALHEIVDVQPHTYAYEIFLRPELKPALGQVRVQAMDAEDNPIRISSLHLARLNVGHAAHEDFLTYSQETVPDDLGLVSLAVGRYGFEAFFDDGNQGMYFPARGEFSLLPENVATVRLQPAPGARLELRLSVDSGQADKAIQGLVVELEPFGGQGSDGVGRSSSRVRIFSRMTSDGALQTMFSPWLDDGPQSLPLVQPGPYTLRIHGHSILPCTREIQLEPGKTASLRIQLRSN